MTTLNDIQKDFQHYVMHGGDRARPHIVGSEAASAEERLLVYYHAYRLRLLEVLNGDFTGLAALVNQETFDTLGKAYIDAHPSTHPSVRWFGEHLAGFLARQAPWTERPELAQMARLEWARGRAFDAADTAAVTTDELTNVAAQAWPMLHIELHPSLQRLELNWNLPEVWHAVSAGQALPALQRYSAPVRWAIWRQDLVVYWRSLDPAEDHAINVFDSGGDFADVCSGLCEWHEESAVPKFAAGLLRHWASEGLISSVDTGGD